jgi:phosphatidylglycerol lysyltransferase
MIPVPGRDGFFVEHLLRDPEAPNGTVELMVDTAMRWASDRGASWLTLGLAPLAGEVGLALRIARRLTWLYDFEGLRRFKAKLRPRDWLPVYLAYPRSQGAALTTFDALAAFATGGMLRFGARLVTRGHPAVLRALAMLLLPWTVLLAASSPAHWFDGHAAVKWAWTAFDAGVCAGLFRLLRRPSSALASLLAALVALDAVLGAVEALLWNVPRLHGGLDLAVIAAGIAGPTVAALALRGATARLERASL